MRPLSTKADGRVERDLRSERHGESQDANHGNVREDAVNALTVREISGSVQVFSGGPGEAKNAAHSISSQTGLH